MDKSKGRLEAGMKADFIVLAMEWSPEDLLQAKVLQTWFNGRKVAIADDK
jgi:predicted amidohydrolase YtcJ